MIEEQEKELFSVKKQGLPLVGVAKSMSGQTRQIVPQRKASTEQSMMIDSAQDSAPSSYLVLSFAPR